MNSKSLKHKGIKAEIHGILEKYGTINKTKHFLNISTDISRPEEITQEKVYLNFNFQNVKLPYESYKGDYATIKYYIKIIIISTYKNAEYEKEFAVVNPYDSSILKKNDEPIRMQVGMKQKMSLSIYFQHKNYNCRGTLKGFIQFNYLNINLKFMEVQIVRREVVFGDKKCEPAYVARYELIDGVPTKNERIPIRFFLKSYNLTPSYPNIDNVFCVRYFLNLVIADEEDNRYFKQKEICLFRLYKERKNICNYSNNYNDNDDEYYNNNYNNEIFITEPIYEEDFSLYYHPAFGGKNNDNFNEDYDDNYGINPNMPSINENESYDYGYDNNNLNNDRRNRNNNFNNNRINTFNNRNNDNNNIINENNYDNRNLNKNNINKNFENNNNINYNRNKTYNNKNERKNIFSDDYNEEEDDKYNYNNNFRKNNNNINNDNYMNRGKNPIINNNPSNYYSIKTKNNPNSYNEANMFDDDINNNNYGLNNINDINDLAKLEKKSSHSHRNNLMQARISSEDDFKNIFNSLDKNANKEELKKNIFG